MHFRNFNIKSEYFKKCPSWGKRGQSFAKTGQLICSLRLNQENLSMFFISQVSKVQKFSLTVKITMYWDPHRHLLVLGCRQLWNLFPCPKSQRAFNFPAVIETSYSDRDFSFHRHLGTLLQQKSVTRRVYVLTKI